MDALNIHTGDLVEKFRLLAFRQLHLIALEEDLGGDTLYLKLPTKDGFATLLLPATVMRKMESAISFGMLDNLKKANQNNYEIVDLQMRLRFVEMEELEAWGTTASAMWWLNEGSIFMLEKEIQFRDRDTTYKYTEVKAESILSVVIKEKAIKKILKKQEEN